MPDRNPLPTVGDVVWHRHEYIHRRVELIDVDTIAQIAGTARSTVHSWRAKHPDTFPGPAMAIIGPGDNPRYFYPTGEIVSWLLHHRPGGRAAGEPARLSGVIAHLEQRIEANREELHHLTAVKEQIARACQGGPVR